MYSKRKLRKGAKEGVKNLNISPAVKKNMAVTGRQINVLFWLRTIQSNSVHKLLPPLIFIRSYQYTLFSNETYSGGVYMEVSWPGSPGWLGLPRQLFSAFI